MNNVLQASNLSLHVKRSGSEALHLQLENTCTIFYFLLSLIYRMPGAFTRMFGRPAATASVRVGGTIKKYKPRRKRFYKKKVQRVAVVNPDTARSKINNIAQLHRFKRSLVAQNTFNSFTAANTVTAGTTFFVQPAGSGTTNILGGLMGFRLTDVPNVTEFTNLFCKYRVKSVKVTVRMPDAPSSTANDSPCLYLWKNHDPSLLSVTVAAPLLDQAQRVTKYQFSAEHRSVSVKIYPYLMELVNIGSGATALANERYGDWLDVTYPTALYYSLAYCFTDVIGSSLSVLGFEVDYEYDIEFKDAL